MAAFTSVFGGDNIQPSFLSYATYSIAADLTLVWAFEALDGANIAAAKIDVAATVANLSVQLPDSTLVSVGRDILIKNTGANTFSVKDADGNFIGSVASGVAWYFYLETNATAGGTWGSVQFGAATSTANAASLAGAGLQAVGTLLNQNLPAHTKPGNYSPVSGDRATVLRGTGGAVVYTPASAVTLGLGWFVYVINNGSGSLTWTPSGGQTVDGAATKVLNPTESAIFFSDGANFWTLGYGRSIISTVTAATVNAAGTGTLTLSSTQATAQVQNFIGALTGDRIIEYGTGVGYWFVRNATSAAHTMTFRVNSSDAGVVVPQGNFSILRSDGTNMSVAFSSAAGTVTSVATTADLTGGPITTSGTLGLSDTAVTPGTIGSVSVVPVVTVDQKGRITALTAANLGTAAAINVGTAANLIPQLDGSGMLLPQVGGVPTGTILDYIDAFTAPAGYVFPNGTTIGDASSGATGRANADTVNLFTLLWNKWANAQAAVSGGRGANAAADFAAHKTITLPDLRGRVIAAVDNLGGIASATRLSTVLASTTPGVAGGAQTTSAAVTVSSISGSTSGSMSGTTGGPSAPFQDVGGTGTSVATIGHTHNVTVSGSLTVTATGSGTTATFNTVQPTMVMGKILKL